MQIKAATSAMNGKYQHIFFILLFNVVEISGLVAKAIQDVTAVNVHWARLETLQSNSRKSWLHSCFAFEEEKLICEEAHAAR